ncbi:MAG: hypothetical protein R3E89_14730 [Thiolinea sp.]
MATLATPLQDEAELHSPNCVKGGAGCCWTGPVFQPFCRFSDTASEAPCRCRIARPAPYRHVCLSGQRFCVLHPPAALCPGRAGETGSNCVPVLWLRIHVDLAREIPGPGVDTAADLWPWWKACCWSAEARKK